MLCRLLIHSVSRVSCRTSTTCSVTHKIMEPLFWNFNPCQLSYQDGAVPICSCRFLTSQFHLSEFQKSNKRIFSACLGFGFALVGVDGDGGVARNEHYLRCRAIHCRCWFHLHYLDLIKLSFLLYISTIILYSQWASLNPSLFFPPTPRRLCLFLHWPIE